MTATVIGLFLALAAPALTRAWVAAQVLRGRRVVLTRRTLAVPYVVSGLGTLGLAAVFLAQPALPSPFRVVALSSPLVVLALLGLLIAALPHVACYSVEGSVLADVIARALHEEGLTHERTPEGFLLTDRGARILVPQVARLDYGEVRIRGLERRRRTGLLQSIDRRARALAAPRPAGRRLGLVLMAHATVIVLAALAITVAARSVADRVAAIAVSAPTAPAHSVVAPDRRGGHGGLDVDGPR